MTPFQQHDQNVKQLKLLVRLGLDVRESYEMLKSLRETLRAAQALCLHNPPRPKKPSCKSDFRLKHWCSLCGKIVPSITYSEIEK